MNFLADESVDYNLFRVLKDSGYNIIHVTDIFPGKSDREILEYAHKEDRIIITEDKDFGELTIRFKLDSKGIVLLRFLNLSHAEKKKLVLESFEKHSSEMYQSFTVISDNRIRIRK